MIKQFFNRLALVVFSPRSILVGLTLCVGLAIYAPVRATGLYQASQYNPKAVAITGGTINGAVVGGTQAAAGTFTTLAASSIASTGALSASGVTATSDGPIVAGTFSTSSPTALLISHVAPTIASGFGTGASITATNGTAFFKINVGTTPGNTGTITMPAASNGWFCVGREMTTTSMGLNPAVTSSTTTSITIQNYNPSLAAWNNNDVLGFICIAY